MEKRTVKVPSIGRDGCVNTIKSEVSALPGVLSVQGNPETQLVTIEWNIPATWENISHRMTEIDYAPGRLG